MGLYLDPDTHDLVVAADKRMRLIASRSEQAAQSIHTRFKHVRGEAFTDSTEGFPWFTDVLEKGVDQSRIKALARRLISSVPGVVDVPLVSLEIEPTTRVGEITWEARLDTGATISSEDYGTLVLGDNGTIRP